MRNSELDKKLKEAFKKHLDEQELKQMKDGIWKSLNIPRERRRSPMKKLSIVFTVAAVLLIGFIVFSANTEPGQAMMQSIRDIFVEEKQEVIEIEGHKEEIDVNLETNEELSYVIYVDESRYQLIKGDHADRIEMSEPVEGDFPEVYMEIYREENTTTEEVVEEIKREIEADESMGIRREERVTEPMEAEMIQGMGLQLSGDEESFESEWNTPIHRYYVTDTKNEQVFVIKQVYFLEAAEGHGARFHYMLESFEIVEE